MPDALSSVASISNPLLLAGTAAQTGLGLLKAGIGFFDNKKANKELEELKTPFYKINDEYFQNRNIAASQAEQGIGAATRNYMTTGAERGLGSTLGAIGQVGGDVSDIAKALDIYNQNIQGIGAQDIAQRTANIQQFMERNKDVAGQKTMQWAINEYQPYENKVQQLQERIRANKQNMLGGLSDAVGGVAAGATALQNADLMEAMKGFYRGIGNTNTSNGNGLGIGTPEIAPITSSDWYSTISPDVMTRTNPSYAVNPNETPTFDYNSLNDQDKAAIWNDINLKIGRK